NSQVFGPREVGPLPIIGAQGEGGVNSCGLVCVTQEFIPCPTIPSLSEDAVFVPFRLRLQPFIGRRDIGEMPLRRPFGTSALANADQKRRKRSKRASTG